LVKVTANLPGICGSANENWNHRHCEALQSQKKASIKKCFRDHGAKSDSLFNQFALRLAAPQTKQSKSAKFERLIRRAPVLSIRVNPNFFHPFP
jgi:hypothetical protein